MKLPMVFPLARELEPLFTERSSFPKNTGIKSSSEGVKMEFKKSGMALLLALATLGTIVTAGCGKDKDNNSYGNGYGDGTGRVAQVPTADVCQPNRPVNPQVWNPYQQYGFRNYNYTPGYGTPGYGPYNNAYGQQFYANGFCGCPVGYQPVCDPRVGMSCMPVSLFQGNQYQFAWYGWNSGLNNFSFNNFGGYAGYNNGGLPTAGYPGQYPNSYPGYPGYPSGGYPGQSVGGIAGNPYCAQNIGQTCQVGTNSCGNGICRPVSYNSPIGVCVR